MSYQVLALKYRPKRFSDAVGQEAITRTLKNSIINDKIGHAYLLTGTRGIGKTTIARVFAKAIRCLNLGAEGEPCLECAHCLEIEKSQSLDFIEIDGASNNSVDDIRDLIENVQYLPTNGKYKVYLIDEVHMLSTPAFNALLKTLEEPPKHVIFMFATTDPQKLLGTVLSRCLRFDFKNASEKDLILHLNNVAGAEDINFQSQVIPQVIAKQASGSFRDALSLLDQVISLSSDKNVTEESLFLSLGMAKTQSVNQILKAIVEKDKAMTLAVFNQVTSENVDFKKFTLQILDKIYDTISDLSRGEIAEEDKFMTSVSTAEIMWIYETIFRDIEWSLNSIDPQKATSFVLVKVAMREEILGGKSAPVEVKKKTELEPIPKQITPTPSAPAQELPAEVPTQAETAPVGPISWEGFIKELYKNNKPIAVNLERGNLLNKESLGKGNATLNIAFTEECRIFYDFLHEYENTQSLIRSLASYTSLSEGEVSVNLHVINEQVRADQNFRSSVEIEEDKILFERNQRKKEIETNRFIKEAEELFNSKVDKIILNEEN